MAKWFRKTFFIGGKAVEAEVRVEEITVYDRAGNKIFRDFNGGPEDTMESDARGNPVHGRNDWGGEVWMEYDGSGRLVHVRGAVDPFASADYEQWYEYDDAGRLVRVWTPYGKEMRREYDGNGNLVHEKDTFRHREEWREYNADGNLVHMKDTLLGEEWRDYDDAGRLVHRTYTQGRVPRRARGLREYIEDGQDTGGRSRTTDKAEERPADKTQKKTEEWYEYDADGTLVRKKISRGGKIRYEYGADGALSRKAGSDGGGELRDYDDGGRLVRFGFPDGDYEWRYEYEFYDDGAVRRRIRYRAVPADGERLSKEKEREA